MQIFPAIDLSGGQVVRLYQGDYDQMTVYGQDPCAVAREFLDAGCLHVVDLDGARDGTLANFESIAAIARQGGLSSKWAAAFAPRTGFGSTWTWG